MLPLFQRRTAPSRQTEGKVISLLVDLSRRERKIVDGFMHQRSYLRDEIVFDEGEEGQALYIILDGQVVICHPDQLERPIAVLEAGDFFGELALLDNGPRTAQARAAENCRLLVLFRGDFQELMDAHARIASKIALQFARHLSARMRKMATYDASLL